MGESGVLGQVMDTIEADPELRASDLHLRRYESLSDAENRNAQAPSASVAGAS